jgi:polar amino acid transport system substrate-binding protein
LILFRLILIAVVLHLKLDLAAAEDTGPVEIYYHIRPPFYEVTGDGKVTGLLVTPAEQAFNDAGIKHVWVLTPVNRILANLRSGNALACSSGWYRDEERERDFLYTKPIYRDRGVAAVLGQRVNVPFDGRLTTLLDVPLRHIFKSGLISGGVIGPYLAAIPPEKKRYVTLEVDGIVRMIQADHGDIFIGPAEELDQFGNDPNLADANIKIFPINEPAVHEQRFIICSKNVPQSVINALNAHIPKLPE